MDDRRLNKEMNDIFETCLSLNKQCSPKKKQLYNHTILTRIPSLLEKKFDELKDLYTFDNRKFKIYVECFKQHIIEYVKQDLELITNVQHQNKFNISIYVLENFLFAESQICCNAFLDMLSTAFLMSMDFVLNNCTDMKVTAIYVYHLSINYIIDKINIVNFHYSKNFLNNYKHSIKLQKEITKQKDRMELEALLEEEKEVYTLFYS